MLTSYGDQSIGSQCKSNNQIATLPLNGIMTLKIWTVPNIFTTAMNVKVGAWYFLFFLQMIALGKIRKMLFILSKKLFILKIFKFLQVFPFLSTLS